MKFSGTWARDQKSPVLREIRKEPQKPHILRPPAKVAGPLPADVSIIGKISNNPGVITLSAVIIGTPGRCGPDICKRRYLSRLSAPEGIFLRRILKHCSRRSCSVAINKQKAFALTGVEVIIAVIVDGHIDARMPLFEAV